MDGASVTVVRRADGALDRLGNPTKGEPTRETVPGVLIAPGATADLEASRPKGVTVAYTLHFPKTYAGSLRGCEVELPEPYDWGNPYRVVGTPAPYMGANTPTRWHMPVNLEAADG